MRSLAFLGYSGYAITSLGDVFSFKTMSFLTPHSNYGYLRVSLRDDHGAKKTYRIHRLLAMAYFPESEWNEVVNHKDGNRANNAISNLEWCSQSENVKHAHETGLVKNPHRDRQRKISEDTARLVCEMILKNMTNREILAKLPDLTPSIVSGIRAKTVYTNIVKDYDFSNVFNSNRKLNDEKLRKVCEMIQRGSSWAEIKSEAKVSSATISKIKSRKTGMHVSKDYVW